LIGGNIDLDHLSLFSQRYARIMRGIERRISFPRSTVEGRERERQREREREQNELTKEEEVDGYLYTLP
jgi:hypothetical protein